MKRIYTLVIWLFTFHAVSSQNILARIDFDNGQPIAKQEVLGQYSEITGSVFEATTTTDRFGNANSAYAFDGIDDYVSFGDRFPVQDGYTVSLWFKIEGVPSNTWNTLLARGYTNDGDYSLIVYRTGGLNYAAMSYEGTFFFDGPPIDNGWHQMTGVFETGTNNIRLYLDGQRVGTRTSTSDIVGVTDNDFYIGNWVGSNVDNFKGAVDDIVLYSTPISDQQVLALYEANELNTDIDEPGFGTALDFDGVDDMVLSPTDTLVETPDGFTVETWVRWTGADPDKRSVFYAGADFSDYFLLTDNGFIAVNGTNAGNRESISLPITPPGDNAWHHLAVTFDVPANEAKIYLDGNLESTAPNGLAPINNTNGSAPAASQIWSFPDLGNQLRAHTLGRDHFYQDYLEGQIDEFRIWNYPRTQDEINAYRQLSPKPSTPGLIFYQKFDEGEPAGNNSNIDDTFDQVAGRSSDLLGFNKVGSMSNYVLSTIPRKSNAPKILSISPQSVLPGDKITIFANNLIPREGFNKVFIGGIEAEPAQPEYVNPFSFPIPNRQESTPISSNYIKVIVPEGIKGQVDVYIINGAGFSASAELFVVEPELSSLLYSFIQEEVYTNAVGPVSVNTGDFNKDGIADIVLGSKTDLQVLTNDGNGNYTQYYKGVVAADENGVNFISVADLDGDELQDLVYYKRPNIQWSRNTGSGFAAPIIIMNNPDLAGPGDGEVGTFVASDIDFDGDMDIVTRRLLGWGFLRNNGSGGFAAYTEMDNTSNYLGMDVGDMNEDNLPDVVVTVNSYILTDDSNNEVIIFYNNGNSTFRKESLSTGFGGGSNSYRDFGNNVRIADFNKDDVNDVFVAPFNAPFRSFEWLGNKNSSRGRNNYGSTQIFFEGVFVDTEIADVNADNISDIIAVSRGGEVFVAYGRKIELFPGSGFFEFSFGDIERIASDVFTASDAVFTDADNDGDLDVVLSSRDDNKISVLFHRYSGNDFAAYSLDDQVGNTQIDLNQRLVSIVVPNNYSLTKVVPTFELSRGALATLLGESQTSNSSVVDFTSPVNYEIEAEDGSFSSWTVEVNALPGTPVLNNPGNIEQTSFDISWSVPTKADSYVLEISSDNFNSKELIEVLGNDTSLTVVPGTLYQVRVKGKNDGGVSASYSNVEEFITIPGNPTLQNANSITTTSSLLSWDEISGADQYRMDVSFDAGFTNFLGSYEKRIIQNTFEQLSQLTPGTRYWARVRSENEAGVSGNSNTTSFITIPRTPALEISSVSQTEVAIEWQTTSGADGYRLQQIQSTDTVTVDLNNTTDNYLFSELDSGATYQFRIRSFNASGNSDYSGVEETTTIPAIPGISSVSEITTNAALVDWNDVKGISNYFVDVAQDENFINLLGGYTNLSVSSSNQVLAGLAPGKRYFIRISAANASGVSQKSKVTDFITINNGISAAVSAVTQTGFSLNWSGQAGSSEYVIHVADESDTTVYLVDSDMQSLTISNLMEGTSYFYRIAVRNESGTSAYSDFEEITTLPIDPNSLTVSEISASNVVISWSSIVGASSYVLDVARDASFNNFVGGYQERVVVANSEVITGLSAGQTYYVRVKAANNSGQSGFSPILNILTIPAVPETQEVEVTNSSFEISVSSIAGATSYKWQLIDQNEIEFEDSQNSYVFAGLAPGRQYKYRVASVNSSGVSSFSPTREITTIPAEPSSITISNTSSNTSFLDWDDVEGADEYYIDVATDNTFNNFVGGFQERIISSTSEVITGLEAGKNYFVRLRAGNSSGQSEYSAIEGFITIPPSPQLQLSAVSPNSISVTWASTPGTTSYDLRLISGNDTIIVNASGNNYEFSDLVAGKSYNLSARSVNATGSSAFSSQSSITTVPGKVDGVNFSEINETSILVDWSPIGGAESYLMDVARNSQFTDLVGGFQGRRINSNLENIVGLLPGRTYFLRVLAQNENGQGSFSDVVNFITLPAAPEITNLIPGEISAVVQWASVVGTDSYEVFYNSGGDTLSAKVDAGTNQVELASLSPATSYNILLQSANEAGKSVFSDVTNLLTLPERPGGLSVSSIGLTTASVAWDDVEGAASYSLEVSDNSFSSNIRQYNPKVVTSTSEIIDNLNSNRNYQIRLQSINSSGKSSYSDTLEILTLPDAPIARDASSVTSTSFNANWDDVEGSNVTYVVEVSLFSDFQELFITETVTGSLSAAVSNLKPGSSAWYRVKAVNSSGSSAFSNVISIRQPLQVVGLSYSQSLSRSSTSNIPVSFDVSGGLNDYEVKFLYKGILESSFEEQILTPSENGYSIDISAENADDIGLEFEIIVDDGENILELRENFAYWSDIENEIPLLKLAGKWQMFSIPYRLEDNLIESIFDEAGPLEYTFDWRLVRYNTGSYVDAGAGLSRIELGKGYWFQSLDTISIKLGRGDVNLESPYQMELDQGWNQIGNPYNVAINWNSILESNNPGSSIESLQLWNARQELFVEGNVLNPFEGAFVWSDQPTTLGISLSNNRSSASTESSGWIDGNDIDKENWIFPIELKVNGQKYSDASVGMHTEASESKDPLDQMMLPEFSTYATLSSIHDEYFYPWFKTDIKPNSTKESWLYQLQSNIEKGVAILTWDNQTLKNKSANLWLIDEEKGLVVNMEDQNQYVIRKTNNAEVSIHYLTDPTAEPIPFRFSLSDPYPNPTDGPVSFNLNLPETRPQYDILVELYDIKGNLLQKIADDSLVPGKYDFNINLNDLKNGTLPGGIYFCKLTINQNSQSATTKKIILNKK